MAKERITIRINEMPDEDFKKCLSCSAEGTGLDISTSTPYFPYCKIAQLHKELGKRPRLWHIVEKGININLVPKDCPNGY